MKLHLGRHYHDITQFIFAYKLINYTKAKSGGACERTQTTKAIVNVVTPFYNSQPLNSDCRDSEKEAPFRTFISIFHHSIHYTMANKGG